MFGKKKKKKQDPFEGWREEDDHATDLSPDYEHFNDPKIEWPSPDTVYVKPKEFEGSQWGLMSNETKQRIQREAGVNMPSGMYYDDLTTHPLNLQTGTVPWAMEVRGGIHADRISVDQMDVDALWEKMYERMRKVIVVCKYCQTPNVIDNQTCTQCGAPLPVEYL